MIGIRQIRCCASFEIKGPSAKILAALLASTSVNIQAEESGAAATGTLEEVVITAQKREENLQKVPIAISVMNGVELERRGIKSFDAIAQASPSISFVPYPQSASTLMMYMRGQGSTFASDISADGTVGLYVDGFYIARPQTSTFDLADMERVEVLRGPQGTLYGRNTTGGAVNIISKKPTGEFGFKQTLEVGNRNQVRSLTTVNLPEWHNLSAKATFLKSSVHGYVKTAGPGADFGEQKQEAGRVQLRWAPAANFAADYFMDKGSLDDTGLYYQRPALNGRTIVPGYPYFAADGPMRATYRPLNLPLTPSDFETHGLTLSWDVSDALTIKSLTGYRELVTNVYSNWVEAFDLSFSGNTVIKQHQVSQELQFIGTLLDGGVHYVAGLYYFREHGSNLAFLDYPSLVLNTTKTTTADARSKALFGQVSWEPDILGKRLELTLGARYTEDEKEASRTSSVVNHGNLFVIENGAATGTVNSASYSRFNPAFTINYKWTDDVLTYAKVATGYKAGGSNAAQPIGQFNQTFGPEDLRSYEVGLKSNWLGHRLRVNAAAFQAKLKNQQMLLPADPNDLTVAIPYNAGRSTVQGVELEVLAAPMPDFSIGLDYTLTDARYDSVLALRGTAFDPDVNRASPYQVGQDIKDLFGMPQVPKHSINVSADYTFLRFGNADLSAHLDYRWRDAIYETAASGPAIANRDLNMLPAYGLLNGRLSANAKFARGDQVSVSLWSANILNKEYVQSSIGLGQTFVATSANPASGFTGSAVSWAPPRSYGISVTYEY